MAKATKTEETATEATTAPAAKPAAAAKEVPQKPSVGRIVHYHTEKGAVAMGAMVTGVGRLVMDAEKGVTADVVSLTVLPEGRTPFHEENILHQDDVTGSSPYWNYPPRS